MNLDKAIEKRQSVRNFKDKKPDWRKIIEAIDAARKVPLAGNINTLKFILVSDKEKIKEIADACQQKFIKQVEYVVVVCSDNKDVVLAYDERGLRYSRQQAGSAIQNFFLKITDLGLATCWVGAYADKTIKKILTIPDEIEVEALFPVGYEFGKTKPRKKPDLDNVLYFDKWKNRYMKPLRKPLT